MWEHVQKIIEIFSDKIGARQRIELAALGILLYVLSRVASGAIDQPHLLATTSGLLVAAFYVALFYAFHRRALVLVGALFLSVGWGIWYRHYWTSDSRRVARLLASGYSLDQRGLRSEAAQRFAECRDLPSVAQAKKVECLCALGAQQTALGDRGAARDTLTACYAIAVEHQLHGQEVAALCLLGRLEYIVDELEPARQYYNKALTLSRKIDSPQGLACANRGLGDLLMKEGHGSAAKPLLAEALELYRRSRDPMGQAYTLTSLAELERVRGDLRLALKDYASAERIYDESKNDAGKAEVLVHLAGIQGRLGMTDAARADYKSALGIHQRLRDPYGQTLALLGLGQVERIAKRLDLAHSYLLEALQLSRKISDLAHEAQALIELAGVEIRMGQRDTAATRYEKARPLCQRVDDLLCEGNAVLGMAELERMRAYKAGREASNAERHAKRARAYYAEARRLYIHGGYPHGVANVDLAEGVFLLGLGEKDEARKLIERASTAMNEMDMHVRLNAVPSEDMKTRWREAESKAGAAPDP